MIGLSEPIEQLLIDQAHRFDGYAWARADGDPKGGGPNYLNERLYQPFQTTLRVPVDPAEALALNFYLHRNFHHWGNLPGPGGADWMQMVLLYLHTYRLPTPKAFRHELAASWEQRPKGSAEAAAAEIRAALTRGLAGRPG